MTTLVTSDDDKSLILTWYSSASLLAYITFNVWRYLVPRVERLYLEQTFLAAPKTFSNGLQTMAEQGMIRMNDKNWSFEKLESFDI